MILKKHPKGNKCEKRPFPSLANGKLSGNVILIFWTYDYLLVRPLLVRLPTSTTYLLLRTYYNVPTYLLLPSYDYLPFTTYCYYRPTYYYYYLHIVLSKFSLSGQLFQSGANAVKRVYYRYNNKVFTLNLRQLIDHHSRPLCLYNCLFNEVNSN